MPVNRKDNAVLVILFDDSFQVRYNTINIAFERILFDIALVAEKDEGVEETVSGPRFQFANKRVWDNLLFSFLERSLHL